MKRMHLSFICVHLRHLRLIPLRFFSVTSSVLSVTSVVNRLSYFLRVFVPSWQINSLGDSGTSSASVVASCNHFTRSLRLGGESHSLPTQKPPLARGGFFATDPNKLLSIYRPRILRRTGPIAPIAIELIAISAAGGSGTELGLAGVCWKVLSTSEIVAVPLFVVE